MSFCLLLPEVSRFIKSLLLSSVQRLLWSNSQVYSLTPLRRGRGKGRERMVPVCRRERARGRRSKGEQCGTMMITHSDLRYLHMATIQPHSQALHHRPACSDSSLTSFPNPGPPLLPHSFPPPGSPSPPSAKTSSGGWAGRARWRPYSCKGEAHVDCHVTRLLCGHVITMHIVM